MRDALSDLLQAETRYAPVVDAEGRIAGRALGRDHLRVPDLARGADRGAHGRRAAAGGVTDRLAPTIAQASSDFFRDRSRVGLHPGQRRLLRRLGARQLRPLRRPAARAPRPRRRLGRRSASLIAFAMALASHRRRWLVPPFIGATGVLYTIPSLAFFFLLLPITGRGTDTAIIALTAFTLQIIYRNIVAGLANVPGDAKDAGRGMGMTDRQLLWRVELPLAVPEIIAGVRIATVSTVAIATPRRVRRRGWPRLGDRRRLEHHLPHRRRHRQRAADRDGDRLRRPAVAGPAAADALAIGGRGPRGAARRPPPRPRPAGPEDGLT